MKAIIALFLLLSVSLVRGQQAEKQPNVIFIALDDLNDWVHAFGYEQAKTPNFDRLAKAGIKFSNAHTPGVYCAPSRTAIFTGMHASTTGCYNEQVFSYDHPQLTTLQMAFQQGGYQTFGAGKLYHHMPGHLDLRGWDQYFTRSQQVKDMGWTMNGYHMKDVPLPTPYPYSPFWANGKKGNFLEWGPIDNSREEEMVDPIRTNWACDVLKQKHDKPFFLALGLFSPHYPNYSPQKYFDLYDLDDIKLPPQKEDDLADLPAGIQKLMEGRTKSYFKTKELGLMKETLRAYLAAISFADAMVGRVLDAVESSSYKDNTIIVLWSDHGFHQGEKMMFGKHTLWERTSNIPFIWAGKGIAKNTEVKTTVSSIDIYPTLAEWCRLPVKTKFDGVSMAPVLKKPSKAKDRNVLLPHLDRGSYAVINKDWRYIYYNDGTEELYNEKVDPNEWYNLAGDKKYSAVINTMKKSAPAIFAPVATGTKDLKLVITGDTFHWEKKKAGETDKKAED